MAGRLRCWRALRQCATRLRPGLQAAVEHGHGPVAQPLQHPPQAATESAAIAVVHHGLHAAGKTRAAQPRGKCLARGQGVAPAGDALTPVVGRQGLVQVRIHRAGDVALLVLLRTGVGVGQIEAAVEHHAGLAAVQQRLQFGDGNQKGVRHGLVRNWWLWGVARRNDGRILAGSRKVESGGMIGLVASFTPFQVVLRAPRARSTVARMPLPTIKAMPIQPKAGMWSSNSSTL